MNLLKNYQMDLRHLLVKEGKNYQSDKTTDWNCKSSYKKPDILIFDEATSAVDNETEHLIQKALKEIAKNCTTIVIAHRLSTIKNSNKIIVIGNQGIVEEGTHSQLIENNNFYKQLWIFKLK